MRTQFEKIKTFMNLPQSHLIAAFLPWIFFSMVRPTSLLIASIGAILLMGLFNFRELRKGFVMPLGSIVVFALLALNNLFEFSKWMEAHTFILINSALAAIVWFSMAIGNPFTIQYAREEVDRSRWNHPIFLKINWILTSLWAVLMTISALPGYFLTMDQITSSWFWSYGLSILCVVIGFRCNKKIPKIFGR